MPPRIAYWTSAFDPACEAVASEVATLRRRFPGSIAWGMHPRRWALFSWQRGYGFNPRLHLLFRAATRVLEPAFQLNHVFGSLGDWFYLEGKRRRPIVLTMANAAAPVSAPLLERVRCFVAEHPGGTSDLEKLGVERNRIRLILPPVDLRRFAPASSPSGRFTVLFASSPERPDWLEARGVPLLLAAAALRPDMDFRLLWRPWGTSLQRVHAWVGERGLRNIEVVAGYWKNMPRQYHAAHVTIAPFTSLERNKSAPNSLIESMACGRPVVATEVVGLGELLAEEGAGRVCATRPEAVAEALDQVRADWQQYARRAREVAERHFGLDRFLHAHERLYAEVLGN